MAADSERGYDVVVLSAGPIGQNVADPARATGLSVAVVARELVGGESIGCGTPFHASRQSANCG